MPSLGSVEFSKLLLARAKVAVAPGLGFGEHGEGYVRIALVENTHRLRQAVRNIRAFMQAGSNVAEPIAVRSGRAMTRPLSVALAGLGTVGGGVLKLLRDNADIVAARAGRPIAVTAVSARDRTQRPRRVAVSGLRWYDDPVALAADPGGRCGRGADRRLRRAGARAGRGGDRRRQAGGHRQQGAAGGAWRRAGRAGRGTRRAAGVRGGGRRRHPGDQGAARGPGRQPHQPRRRHPERHLQLHPDQMRERGREFAEVLADAQKLGYAEADPSFDIDGIDAAHKLAILAALAFGRPVAFDAVHVEGIRRISALDIAFATELGYRIKLLGIARQTEAGIETRVHPCMVPQSAPIARVDGVFNAVVAEGDFVGRVMLEGRGAGRGADRLGRGRRPDRHRAQPASRRSGARRRPRCRTRRRCR